MTPSSSFQTVTLQRCAAGAGAVLYWWNATSAAWEAVSPQSYAGDCITAQLNGTTSSPLLSQLEGTPFAVSQSLASQSAGAFGGAGGGGAGATPAAQPPVVSGVSLRSGSPGTAVTVSGSGFTGATTVWFGGALAQYAVDSDTRITATAPAGHGTVDVAVVTPAGRSATGTADRFTYGGATAAPPPAPSASFADVPAGFWAAGDIRALVAKGIVAGFPDGTFRPDAPVTRAQFVKMLLLTVGLTPAKRGTPTGFADVPAAAWYAPYVAAAAQADIADGTSPATFSPDATVTREQMTVLLARALKLTQASPIAFKDAGRIDPWARGGVAEAVAAGYVVGFPDGTFRPLDVATRAQAAKVLALALQRPGAAASAAGAPAA